MRKIDQRRLWKQNRIWNFTIDQAGKYKDHGFKNLHIIDLDGALTGKTVNLDIIREIVNKYDLKIEIGGGVRSLDSIKQYIDVGVEKVILGSGAIKNKEFLKEACDKFKSLIALALDARMEIFLYQVGEKIKY